MKKSKDETKSRILSLEKKRSEDKSVSSSEVTRNLFSDVWRDHLDEVRNMAGELKLKGKIKISKVEKSAKVDKIRGSVFLSLLNNK